MKIEYDFREQNKCESANTIQMTHIHCSNFSIRFASASARISSLFTHEKSERLDPQFRTHIFLVKLKVAPLAHDELSTNEWNCFFGGILNDVGQQRQNGAINLD